MRGTTSAPEQNGTQRKSIFKKKKKCCLWMFTQWHHHCSLSGQPLPIPLKLAWDNLPLTVSPLRPCGGVPEITCSLHQPISGLFIIWQYLIARVIKVTSSGRRLGLINVDAKCRHLLRKASFNFLVCRRSIFPGVSCQRDPTAPSY